MKKLIIIAVMISVLTSVSNAQFSNNCSNSDMQNYFLKAIEQGDTLKIKQYLELGIPIKGTYCEGYKSNLEYYVQIDEDYNPLKRSKGEGIFDQGIFARIPYIMAVLQSGNEKLIEFFMRNDADINQVFVVPKYGKSKFDPVYRRHHVGIIGSKRVSPVGILFMNLIDGSSSAVIDILMNKYAGTLKLTSDDMEWINRRIKSYYYWPYACATLEKLGYSFDYNSDFLYESIKNKNAENIDYCLNVKNIQPDAKCMIAAFSDARNVELAKRFVEMGIPLESYYDGTTILGHAIKAKNASFVKYLVEKGADINATVTFNQQGNVMTYSSEQGMGFQVSSKTVNLIDFAKMVKAGDDIIECLILAQAKQK